MTEFNPINFNAAGVTNNNFSKTNEEAPKEKATEQNEVSKVETKNIPAKQILDFMTQMATQTAMRLSEIKSSATHLKNASDDEIQAFVDAHLSPERQDSVRTFISAFVNEFEPYVITNLSNRGA